MYKSFPTKTNSSCFIQTWLLSASPCTFQQLLSPLNLMYGVYQMLTSTSGQQQAELNWCQARGLQQDLSIRNLPSWQQQLSGVVWFTYANPAVRSQKDSVGGASGRAWRGAGDREKCLRGARQRQAGALGAAVPWFQQGVCSTTAVILLPTWLGSQSQPPCSQPGWPTHCTHSSAQAQLLLLCSPLPHHSKVEDMIGNHNSHFTSKRGC